MYRENALMLRFKVSPYDLARTHPFDDERPELRSQCFLHVSRLEVAGQLLELAR